MSQPLEYTDFITIRSALLNRQELALLDVREEAPHAEAHPLFAANFPLSRLELNAYAALPRRDVAIVTLDNGEGDAERAARKLSALGYSNVAVFAGGVSAWAAAGGELFRDVNVPSKAFGELVEARRHTPSFSAEEVHAMIEAGADVVIVDARRFDEYRTMSIPTATSVPGAELVLRTPALAPDPRTQIIVNCAGRTRSIIGTQSLINAGLPNPIAALRNGTIGWTLAGFPLDRGAQRRHAASDGRGVDAAPQRARRVADRAGVKRCRTADLAEWQAQEGRTTYFFDVRSGEEYESGHLPGFRHYPGGQLVQETDMAAPVRGARLVLVDDDGVRANMTASWLAQMNWEVFVVDDATLQHVAAVGAWQAPLPEVPTVPGLTAQALAQQLNAANPPTVLDLARHADYASCHIPGAWFAQRSRLHEALAKLPPAGHWVLTCNDGKLAAFAANELQALVDGRVSILEGGNQAWRNAGLALESGPQRQASPPIDRYRRPYEGTDNPREAMQGYLDWEFGLVDQLARDGTHGFFVI